MSKRDKFLAEFKSKLNYFPQIEFGEFECGYVGTIVRIKNESGIWHKQFVIATFTRDQIQLAIKDLMHTVCVAMNFGVVCKILNAPPLYYVDECQLEERDRLKQTYFPNL